jgi:putative component of membrane protein insertase Oxa1/YidC/SpoIIIJ protein YidD
MKITEVTVAELRDFIDSPEYRSLDVKPVTPLRAVSQSANPDASGSDLALVYASEKNTLLAFAGLLPARLNHNQGVAFSNTGWWVNPGLGKTLGLPVFLKAFHGCGQRMFLTDCSAYSKELLERTGMFEFIPQITGKRWFLRFYTEARLRRRESGRLVSGIAGVSDAVLNSLWKPYRTYFQRDGFPEGYELARANRLDNRYAPFIREHSGDYSLKQQVERLNWMVSSQWVTTGSLADEIRYPFSHKVESFQQYFLLISKSEELRAVVLVSVRDNHVSLPFYYGPVQWMGETVRVLSNHIISVGADSLLVFDQRLVGAFEAAGLPAYHTRPVARFAGYSRVLSPFFSGNCRFQDGEADVVFT